MNHHLKQAGLHTLVTTDSAGTGSWHTGELADPRMRATARTYGIELTHKARQIRPEDLNTFSYVLCMDETVLDAVKALHPQPQAQVQLYRHYDPEPENYQVPDPYHGTPEDFEGVYHILNRTTAALLAYLRRSYSLTQVL